jgi:hemolysin D
MEPTNKSLVKELAAAHGKGKAPGRLARLLGMRRKDEVAIDFLPDADELERSPLPPYARITVRVLFIGLAVLLLWACLSRIDEVVVARGRLVNPTPNVVLQPLETSIVQKINVRIGQVVKKGEVLATLDPTFAQADETQLRVRMRSLETQSQQLQAELEGGRSSAAGGDADGLLQARLATERKANYRAQLDKYEQTIARLRASLETNRHDQSVLAARVKSLTEIESMQEKLVAQQFGARLHLLEAQDKRLEMDRELALTRNREQELQRELGATMAEKEAFTKSWRQKAMEDLLSTSRERDGLNEQLAKADKRRRLVNMTSPVDGVVLDIAKLSPGSIAREAETFFTIVPLNAPLEAEVQINSVDVGYIKAGAVAQLKLDAFPFQRHGGLDGKVRTLSEDAFRRETTTGEGTEAFYVSRIDFGNAHLKNMTDKSRLLPGMTVNAEIVVGKRSVISYLLWPLMKAMNESLREP